MKSTIIFSLIGPITAMLLKPRACLKICAGVYIVFTYFGLSFFFLLYSKEYSKELFQLFADAETKFYNIIKHLLCSYFLNLFFKLVNLQ